MTGGMSPDDVCMPEVPPPREAARLQLLPFWIGIGLLMVGLDIYLSLIPIPPIKAMDFAFSDKVGHLFVYGVMAFWFGQIAGRRPVSLLIAFLLALLGVVLEFLQGATGYRTFQLSDMAANTVGAAAGLLLSWTRLGNFVLVLERVLRRTRS